MSGPESEIIKRLGKNLGAYFGEVIDLRQILEDVRAAALRYGWKIETIPVQGGLELLALTRKASLSVTNPRRFYISAGIHGDEPAGPLAVRRLLMEDQLPQTADLWLCPCLNPTGFPMNRRENQNGIDLNRDYLDLESAEIRAHTAWLEQQPQFDLTLCLHEDWESHGFYLYELNPDHQPSLSEPMVAAVAKVCPIDLSETIEGRPAQAGIIRPELAPASRPQWPEAFYLLQYKTRHSYTLEAPSDFPLTARVNALAAAVTVAMEATVVQSR